MRLPAAALILAAVIGDATGDVQCTLVSLILRYQDEPIDLEPPFAPYIHSYRATLDWSFRAFSVDARPDTGCEVNGVPGTPKEVPIGNSAKVTVYAVHPDTGTKKAYILTAYRRLGSETELASLSVRGGELTPVFSGRQRTYSVNLGLGHDVVRIVYGLMDSEQRLTASAQEERQSGAPPPGSAAGGEEETDDEGHANATGKSGDAADSQERRLVVAGASARRLGGESKVISGEAQYRKDHVDFLLDVGFARTVELTVQCADPTQASIGTYTLRITRPGCTPETPFFNPEKKSCVNFCSSGYYRNRETHRCSRCNENCKICKGLLDCDMCLPDTADYSYVIQPDGKCRSIANHLFRKYRWWCAGLGVLLTFLVLIGCCGLVQLCCMGSSPRNGRFMRHDDDSDDEMPRYGGGGRFANY